MSILGPPKWKSKGKKPCQKSAGQLNTEIASCSNFGVGPIPQPKSTAMGNGLATGNFDVSPMSSHMGRIHPDSGITRSPFLKESDRAAPVLKGPRSKNDVDHGPLY